MAPKQATIEAEPKQYVQEVAVKAAEERANFDKAMEKVDEARAQEDTRVPPEEIWKTSEKKPKAKEPEEEDLRDLPEPVRERDETGRFKAKAEEKAQAVEADDDELERAKQALIRSGFRQKELSTMPRDELLSRGLKRAKALEADDEAHLYAKMSRKGSGDPSSKSEKKSEAVSTEPALPALDLKGVSKPLLDEGWIDEKGASALESVLEKVAESAQKPLLGRIGELEQRLSAQTETQGAIYLENARKELLGKYPGLAEPETMKSVSEEMQDAAESKRRMERYRQIPTIQARYVAAMEDAAHALRLETDDSGAAEKQRADTDKVRRRNGRSSVNDRTRPVPTNARDAERQRFDDIMDRHEANAR